MVSIFKLFGWKYILNWIENLGLNSRLLYCFKRFYLMYKKPDHFLSDQLSDRILSNVYSTWDVWLCLLGWTELCISQEGKPFRLLDIKTLLYCQSELFSRLAFANQIHQGKPRLQYEKCQLFWKRTTIDANVFNIPI